MFPIRDDQPTFSTAYVNYFIIALNVVVFLLFEVPAQAQGTRAMSELIAQFGLIPGHFTDALVGHGRYSIPGTFLTIFTSMFMHGGWLHILGNLWFLWIFGDNVEDYMGHFPYLIFYLICGVAAALTDIILPRLTDESTTRKQQVVVKTLARHLTSQLVIVGGGRRGSLAGPAGNNR